VVSHSPGFLKLCQEAKEKVRELTIQQVAELKKRGHRFHFIDVREDNEWAKARLPGAIHLSRGVIERDLEEEIPDKGAEIVLYCGGGFRSALTAESLGKMGYTNVSSMDGGFRGWKAAGLPVEE
jgi:rhodanese-related sulfurtransferase